MFIVDMSMFGVIVKFIIMFIGFKEFLEIFFEDVVIFKDSLMGELNGGWKVVMIMLGFECGINFFVCVVYFWYEVWEIVELVKCVERNGKFVIDDEWIV